MWSKPVYTNRKSASAERCLRALGATLAMGIPVMRRSKHSRQGVFSNQGLRKASAADPVNTGLAGSAGMAADKATRRKARRARAEYRDTLVSAEKVSEYITEVVAMRSFVRFTYLEEVAAQ